MSVALPDAVALAQTLHLNHGAAYWFTMRFPATRLLRIMPDAYQEGKKGPAIRWAWPLWGRKEFSVRDLDSGAGTRIVTMNYLTGFQSILERLPIRGKGRLADAVLSNMSGELECHPLPGTTVSVRANQQIERWMWAGAYETELVSLLKKTLKPGMTFLDLGANIGYFSVIAAALVKDKGHVYAFEPMPQNLTRLRKNLAPFHWASVQPYAVSNATGEVPIRYSDKEAGWASIHDQHRLGNLPCNSSVSVIRLDEWLQSNSLNQVDFIKLDIEGSELDALLGGRQMIGHFRPTIVAETKFGWNYDEIRQLLEATGYKCRPFHVDSILAIPTT
jgi:FkbM family methyltransferase